MSIASQLTALQTDITNARTQITTMGGTVTASGGSSQLATDIATIPTGGSGDLPIGSTITVTSDEGATIEIERGTETQTLVVPSSGSVSFTVHQSGIWNLTANKTGETELTDSVVVSADDTDYPINMFWIYYLYNAGDECTSITGGWIASLIDSRYTASGGYISKASDYIYVKNVSNGSWGARTTNKIDLTNFNTLKITCRLASSSEVGVFANDSFPATSFSLRSIISIGTSYTTVSANIASLNGTYYIVVGDWLAQGLYINKVWLE